MKLHNKLAKAASLMLSAAMALSSVPFVSAQAGSSAPEDYFLRGDIVGNDGVTGKDALAILQHDARVIELTPEQITYSADANEDGKVSIGDAVAILQWVAMCDYALNTTGEYVEYSENKVPELITTGGSLSIPGSFASAEYRTYDFDSETSGHKIRISYVNSGTEEAQIKVITNDGYAFIKCPPTGGEVGEAAVVVPMKPSTDYTVELALVDYGIEFRSMKICRTSNLLDEFFYNESQETTTTTATTATTTAETTTATTTVTEPPVPDQSRYYAAYANVIGGIADEKTNEGYECPDGYANVNNEVGSAVEWNINVPADGNYELTFRYANGTDSNRIMQVAVNGSDDAYYIDFNGTGAWTAWDSSSIVLPLKAGLNTIKLISTTANGGPNLDYLDVELTDKDPYLPAITERYYAVLGELYKGVKETTNAGYAGEAYVNYDNTIGSYVEWTVYAAEEGNYQVDFRFANGNNDNRQCKIITNGDKTHGQYVDFEGTGGWDSWSDTSAVVHLNKGENTIKAYATTSFGGPNMDYIELTQTGSAAPNAKAQQGIRMEKLDRGVAMAHAKNGNMVSWRLLATDNENTTFDLWRIRGDEHTKLGTFTTDQASNYFDAEGLATDSYTIDTYVNGENTEFAQFSTNFTNTNSGVSGAYFDIPLKVPAGVTTPDGVTCTYTANDCSVGDIDGDGKYEIFVKWDPSNSHDNSKNGYSGNVYIDCYKLDGTQVWRVDLGKNIRAGAHYTQFMVYDFDGDGKCEMICKTADGTVDGTGKVIGDGSKDYRSTVAEGKILAGPEYITLFDGATGKALDTQDYDPGRGDHTAWGDTYGNRVDRFTACVAYLDGGSQAYACFGRGYYTRMALAAWGVSNGKLVKKWTWDTGHNVSAKGYGDGNHHCMAADVDGDGKQEVVCGSVVIDDNGQVLYTSTLAHGDAIHIGDFDPTNPGVEIFQCLEDEYHPNGTAVNFGVILRDGKTGKTLYRETAGGDTGRCIADNLIAGNGGAEMNGSHSGDVRLASGEHEVLIQWANITKWGQNSLLYWTDVCERAVLDRAMADQYGKGRVFTGDGVSYNNASKSNMCLTCDLIGDWREEVIGRVGSDNNQSLRVFTTTYTTDYNLYTLMHNAQYRVQIASQNNGYNQPPHTDFYLDSVEYVRPEEPDIWTID